MARAKTTGRVVTGLLIGAAIGGLIYFTTREASAADPVDPPEPGPGPTPPPPPVTVGSTVPAKGPIPYNLALFPDPATTAARLADLSPSYSAALAGELQGDPVQVAGFASATMKFQNDWNALAVQNALTPSRLNASRLTPDGAMGHQTLRALEWGLAMPGWPA